MHPVKGLFSMWYTICTMQQPVHATLNQVYLSLIVQFVQFMLSIFSQCHFHGIIANQFLSWLAFCLEKLNLRLNFIFYCTRKYTLADDLQSHCESHRSLMTWTLWKKDQPLNIIPAISSTYSYISYKFIGHKRNGFA